MPKLKKSKWLHDRSCTWPGFVHMFAALLGAHLDHDPFALDDIANNVILTCEIYFFLKYILQGKKSHYILREMLLKVP